MSWIDIPTTVLADRRKPARITVVSGVVAVAMVFPLLWLVLKAASVDLDRAVSLVFSGSTGEVLLNSVLLMVGVTAGSILLGVPLAYLTVRTDLPFRGVWTILVALPLVVPSYVGAFAFVSAFGPYGQLHDVLAPLGIDRIPEVFGLSGSVFVITLYTYPYVFLTTRAALLSLDTKLFEAARTLNQSRLRAIRRVILPRVRPAIAAGALLTALYAISDFGTPAIMRLSVFTREIYVEYNQFGSEYAALLSLQLLSIVLLVIVLEWFIRPDRSVEVSHPDRSGSRHELGRWRWPAMLLPALVSIVSLAVPVWILLRWLVRADFGVRPTMAFELSHVVNSVSVSLLTALAAAIVAIPVAYAAIVDASPLSTVFERSTYVGFAVPGIVLALALVYFGSGYVSWIYQTIPFLVFAYLIRFLPQAVGSTRTSLLQMNTKWVDAARTLGERPVGAFRRVTMPNIRSGIVAGGALVFLTTMKELPVTLILRPSGFDTLATQIWAAQRTALYQYAAVPALILLIVSGLSMVVLLQQEGFDVR